MTEMPTREELRAFVGPAADYYLAAWEPALTGTGPVTGGNRWAFFFPLFWLGLRRLTGTALVITALLVVELLGEAALTAVGVDLTDWDLLLACAIGLTIGLVCTVRGNGWYLELARQEIADVRSQNLPADEHLAAVASRGGRSVGAMLVVVAGAIVAMMVTEAVTNVIAGR
ncbi:hypothetical protein J0H58_15595 [bacterium]|nr:hypothetical protein [bacterium]